MTESRIIQGVLLRATERGHRLFRNNCGRVQVDGRWIRYGVANPGGSDLIGWTLIGDRAVFTAIEVKHGRTPTTEAQRNFIETVGRFGGIAGIVRSVEEYDAIIDRARARG